MTIQQYNRPVTLWSACLLVLPTVMADRERWCEWVKGIYDDDVSGYHFYKKEYASKTMIKEMPLVRFELRSPFALGKISYVFIPAALSMHNDCTPNTMILSTQKGTFHYLNCVGPVICTLQTCICLK